MKALIKRSDTLPLHVVQDHVVQRLQQAEEALAYAVGIDQERLVMDVAAAQEVFATRQRMGEAVIGQAHTLKTRALVKLGELLKVLPKATGTRGQGRPSLGGSLVVPPKTSEATYAELGVTKKLASVAQQLAALPDPRPPGHDARCGLGRARGRANARGRVRCANTPAPAIAACRLVH